MDALMFLLAFVAVLAAMTGALVWLADRPTESDYDRWGKR